MDQGKDQAESQVGHGVFNGFRAYYVRLTIVGPAEMTTSGAPFVIVLSGLVHEEIGARPGHVVLQA